MSNVIPEQWKRYDENYWVSDQGRVKRVFKNGRVNYLTPIRRNAVDRGYRVKLYSKYRNLNKLVWETFKGKVPDGYTVVNKNGFSTMSDIYSLKLMDRNKSCGLNVYSRRKKVVNLDTGVVYPASRVAAKYLHLSKTTINNYCNKKTGKPLLNLEYFDEDKTYKKTLHFIRD